MNSTGGAVAYGWRPITGAGFATGSIGDDGLGAGGGLPGAGRAGRRGTWRPTPTGPTPPETGPCPSGTSTSTGPTPGLEWVAPGSRTDLFAGYQASFFGWPNLYTPFDSDETENLQTVLVAVNNREDLGGGQYFEGGAFYRRNKDDYAFDRFAPLGPVHPYQHTTWEYGAGFGGPRRDRGDHAQLPRRGDERLAQVDLAHLRPLPQPHAREGRARPRGVLGRRRAAP